MGSVSPCAQSTCSSSWYSNTGDTRVTATAAMAKRSACEYAAIRKGLTERTAAASRAFRCPSCSPQSVDFLSWSKLALRKNLAKQVLSSLGLKYGTLSQPCFSLAVKQTCDEHGSGDLGRVRAPGGGWQERAFPSPSCSVAEGVAWLVLRLKISVPPFSTACAVLP